MSVLTCAGLVAGRGGKPIVGPVTAEVESGQLIVLLGPNGSGKTTLLNTLAGLLPPIAGVVRLDGHEPYLLPARDRARLAALSFQEVPIEFEYTAREVVGMGRLAHGSDPNNGAAIEEAMTCCDVAHLAEKPIGQLSGGERRRVLWAQAMAQDTELVLFDEPTAFQDPKQIGLFAGMVHAMAAGGRTVIAAVHEIPVVANWQCRAWLIGEGKLLAQGWIRDILRSDALESAYQTGFERREIEGRLWIQPRQA